ncbi:hypothetical protein [Microbacterium sp. J1-1]|uniref:hypothetical protein n=1 Tax=Microbacterium sp. J1-1 TaxID=2992441 RepID=UPI002114E564|nr:hypothetical protein [Microbacterium sp. J1-1]UUE21480.1 hypothetical protein LRQ07_04195 [Microbacterium sp. J1-1]
MEDMTTVLPSARVVASDGRPAERSGFLRNIGLYVYVFYVIYTPTFSASFFASKFFILTALAAVLMLHSALSRQRMFRLLGYPPLKRFLVVMFGLSLFVAIVHLATHPEVEDFVDLRIVQNNVLLLMAIHAAFIVHICKSRGFSGESTLRMIYKLAAFQGVWGLLSFVFIPLKDLSNWLYQLAAGDRGEYLMSSRIYGLMGEFTFVTPIYHGMLAAVAVYFALNYRFRGLRYVPLILVAILLNGRTGIAVFAALTALMMLGQVLRGRKVGSALAIVAVLGSLLAIAWTVVSQLSPITARFLQGFVDETTALVADGSVEGTYSVLFQDIVVFPEDLGLIWGTGDDVFQSQGFRSDVGLTNDLFMGGLIFVVIGYGTLAYFLLKNSRPDTVLFLALFAGFAIGIIKGQIFIGTPVLFLFVFVVLLHKQIIDNEMPAKSPRKARRGRSLPVGRDLTTLRA